MTKLPSAAASSKRFKGHHLPHHDRPRPLSKKKKTTKIEIHTTQHSRLTIKALIPSSPPPHNRRSRHHTGVETSKSIATMGIYCIPPLRAHIQDLPTAILLLHSFHLASLTVRIYNHFVLFSTLICACSAHSFPPPPPRPRILP